MKRFLLIALASLLLVAGGVYMVARPHLEGNPPEIKLAEPVAALGKNTSLNLTVSDNQTGLKSFKVAVIQGSKEVAVYEKEWAKEAGEGSTAHTIVLLEINAQELGLTQSEATIVLEARDHAWRNFFHGNVTRLEFPVMVIMNPPRLQVLTRTIHLNRGGSGLVIYRVGNTAVEHGVQVGELFYSGYSPWADDPDARLCYFALADDQPRNTPIRVVARDLAGNQTQASANVQIRWREFKRDSIKLSDNFLNALNNRFGKLAPPDRQQLLDVFLWVNEDMRKINHDVIGAVINKTHINQQLWEGVFSRPRGKPMAGYAERRTYSYNNKEVSKASHLGHDLADVALCPIPAAAAGKVILAQEEGIYGNCIVIAHGQGLFTLYGHMSQLEVTVGQDVEKGQQLGLSGATGLAFGDHLHFSVLVNKTFVNPTEWWDPHWLNDNIQLRFQEAGLPMPSSR